MPRPTMRRYSQLHHNIKQDTSDSTVARPRAEKTQIAESSSRNEEPACRKDDRMTADTRIQVGHPQEDPNANIRCEKRLETAKGHHMPLRTVHANFQVVITLMDARRAERYTESNNATTEIDNAVRGQERMSHSTNERKSYFARPRLPRRNSVSALAMQVATEVEENARAKANKATITQKREKSTDTSLVHERPSKRVSTDRRLD